MCINAHEVYTITIAARSTHTIRIHAMRYMLCAVSEVYAVYTRAMLR